jgi:hypothetical protein
MDREDVLHLLGVIALPVLGCDEVAAQRGRTSRERDKDGRTKGEPRPNHRLSPIVLPSVCSKGADPTGNRMTMTMSQH